MSKVIITTNANIWITWLGGILADSEHQDGIIAKYILAQGNPKWIEINIKRLARFMANQLGEKDYDASMWSKARWHLRTALSSGRVKVGDGAYIARRVEAYPDYRLAFELEGMDLNGHS